LLPETVRRRAFLRSFSVPLYVPDIVTRFLLIILLVFGAKRLPEMGRSLGQGIQELKDGLNSKEEQEKERPEIMGEGEEQAKSGTAREGSREKREASHPKG